jgi:hypothetical protein
VFAVFRVRFDTNLDPGSVWSDALIQNWWDPTIPGSLAHYWQTASRGTFDVRHILFPPIVMADPRLGLPLSVLVKKPKGGGIPAQETYDYMLHRLLLMDAVVAAAHAQVGFDADAFDRAFMWFAQPTDLFGGLTVLAPTSAGGARPLTVAVSDVDSEFRHACHEVGHTFRLGHPFDSTGTQEYGSPYDIMGDPAGIATYLRDPDPRLPDTEKQRRSGPLVSGAELARLPAFNSPQAAVLVDAAARQAGAQVRLFALDSMRNPFLASIPTDNGTYIVELRRSKGYDRGIGDESGPAAGLVIHRLRPDGAILYDDVIPVTSYGGSDWRSLAGGFSIVPGQAAYDLEWADFTVGPLAFGQAHRVRLELVRAYDSSVRTVQEDVVFNAPPCMAGTYSLSTSHRICAVSMQAIVHGFISPAFQWTVNGVIVPPDDETSVRFTTTAHQPGAFPDSPEIIEQRSVRLVGSLTDGHLSLRTQTRGDGIGNFTIDVRVLVSEADPGSGATVIAAVSDSRFVDFRTTVVEWDGRYRAAVERCYGGIRQRVEIIDPPRIVLDPSDPPPYFVDPAALPALLRYEAIIASLAPEQEDLAAELVRYVSLRFRVSADTIRARSSSVIPGQSKLTSPDQFPQNQSAGPAQEPILPETRRNLPSG